MSGIDDKKLDGLIRAAGQSRILGKADIEGRDPGWHPENLGAGFAVSPTSTEEVSRILSFCNQHGVGVVPHGGLTGLAGGAVSSEGQVILMLGGMCSTTVDPEIGIATVEAGATLQAIDNASARPCPGTSIPSNWN